jgi:hypothetical protein
LRAGIGPHKRIPEPIAIGIALPSGAARRAVPPRVAPIAGSVVPKKAAIRTEIVDMFRQAAGPKKEGIDGADLYGKKQASFLASTAKKQVSVPAAQKSTNVARKKAAAVAAKTFAGAGAEQKVSFAAVPSVKKAGIGQKTQTVPAALIKKTSAQKSVASSAKKSRVGEMKSKKTGVGAGRAGKGAKGKGAKGQAKGKGAKGKGAKGKGAKGKGSVVGSLGRPTPVVDNTGYGDLDNVTYQYPITFSENIAERGSAFFLYAVSPSTNTLASMLIAQNNATAGGTTFWLQDEYMDSSCRPFLGHHYLVG